MNFLKIQTKLIFAIIILTGITTVSHAGIPEYKGLYTLFEKQIRQNEYEKRQKELEKSIDEDNIACIQTCQNTNPIIDPISYGQAMLYSGTLENIYTYAHEDNAARKVIEVLWHKHIIDREGNFNPDATFNLSQKYPVNGFTPTIMGKIIKYIRYFNKNKENGSPKTPAEITIVRSKFIRALPKHARSGKNNSALDKFLENLENLKDDPNFYEATAEAILWAFFEKKFDGQESFFNCLNEISPDLKNNLNEKHDFGILAKKFGIDGCKKLLETINKLTSSPHNFDNPEDLNDKDELTYFTIKSVKKGDTPPKVECIQIVHKDKVTGEKLSNPLSPTNLARSETCVESALLELLCVVLYNQKTKLFDPEATLPIEITRNQGFLELIKNIFLSDENSTEKVEPEDPKNGSKPTENKSLELVINPKNLIDPEKINLRTEKFAKMITNLEGIDYGKQCYCSDGKSIFKYDLTARFENFVKLLNNLFNLGLKIIDDQNKFEIEAIEDHDVNTKIEITRDRELFYSIAQGLNSQKCQKILNLITEKLSTKHRPIIVSNVSFLKSDINIDLIVGTTKLTIVLRGAHGEIKVEKNINSILDAVNENHKTKKYSESVLKSLIPIFLFSNKKQKFNNTKILNLVLPGSDILAITQWLPEAQTNEIRLINENANLKNIISKIILTTKQNQKSILEDLISAKLGNLINEKFLEKETYLYIKKIINSNQDKKNLGPEEVYILNNFDKVLLFIDNLDTQEEEINKNSELQKEVLLFMDKKYNEQHNLSDSIENIIQFYKYNLTSNHKNQLLYQSALKKIISEYIKNMEISENYNELSFLAYHLAENTSDKFSDKFKDDFLKEKFIEIVKNKKINLSEIIKLTIATGNKEAIEIIPPI